MGNYLWCFVKVVLLRRGMSFWLSLGIALIFGVGVWNEYPAIRNKINSWQDFVMLPEDASVLLFIGLFVVWLLAVLVHNETMRLLWAARLSFGPPKVHTVDLHDKRDALINGIKIPVQNICTRSVSIATLPVTNRPYDMSDGKAVEKAFCKVQFINYSTNRTVKSFEYPRWTQNPKPSHSTSPIDHIPDEWKYRDLQPVGDINDIDFALKHLNDADAYGFRATSQLKNGWKEDDLKIEPGKYFVKIEVSGKGLRKSDETWLILENPGLGRELIVETTKKPTLMVT